MRLADFISANMEPILANWEEFAGSLSPGALMNRAALRDDAEAILNAAVRDMAAEQSLLQQSEKSKGLGGRGGADSDRLDSASSVHAVARAGSGFNIVEVVSEYRALRASVLRLWRASLPMPHLEDIDDITRFNECIDQSLARAVASYTHRVDETRHMFLGILAHDLRNPLNTIALSTQVALQSEPISDGATNSLRQVESSMRAISRLITDLIDFASTGLGTAMPLSPAPFDFSRLTREVLREMRAAHPTRQIDCTARGDLTVVGDAARLRQVISNLVGNAIQHGSPDHPITVNLDSDGSGLEVRVHNGGTPIPAAALPTIFDPLVRGKVSSGYREPGSIGLGLYIVREVVAAHGGTVEVTSSAAKGTEFLVRLPSQA